MVRVYRINPFHCSQAHHNPPDIGGWSRARPGRPCRSSRGASSRSSDCPPRAAGSGIWGRPSPAKLGVAVAPDESGLVADERRMPRRRREDTHRTCNGFRAPLTRQTGPFVAHRPTDADRPRRVAFVDGTLRTEARLIRTGPYGDVSMGLTAHLHRRAARSSCPTTATAGAGSRTPVAGTDVDVAAGEELLVVEVVELADGVGGWRGATGASRAPSRSSATRGRRAGWRRRGRVRAGDIGRDVDPPSDAPVAAPGGLCVRLDVGAGGGDSGPAGASGSTPRRSRLLPKRPPRPRRRRRRGSGARGSRRVHRRGPADLRTRPATPRPRRAFRGRRISEPPPSSARMSTCALWRRPS